jgi:ERCC4-type nuclease
MVKKYTDKEIADKLKNLTIICDTREQVNGHILGYFDNHKVAHKSRKLDIGDYSAEIDGYTLEHDVVIERKANIDELAGNFTVDRARFEDEFVRAKANGTKVFLLIENGSFSKINSHDYRSKLLPKSLLASLYAWQARYNISVIFCEPEQTGQIIYGILYYYAREQLMKGK